jgi:hypothetical protein
MKNVSIHTNTSEREYAGNNFRVFSFLGLQLCISSQKYCSEEGVNNYVLSYSLFSKISKEGMPLYRRKTRGFKIVKKGRHVWGGTFSRTQTFKRIAE